MTIPYFYIIRHKPTGKMYAGCKYASDADPRNFMCIGGYQTSSKTIQRIILDEGLDSFEVLRVDTNCDGLHVLDYETLFLETHCCAGSDEWFNRHNNTLISYHSPSYIKMMNVNYGTSHPMHSDDIVNRLKASNRYKYGTEWVMGSEHFKAKSIETRREKYGTDYRLQNSEQLKVMLAAYELKTGYKHPFSNPVVISKSDTTKRIKYGEKLEAIVERTFSTNMQKYGVRSWAQTEQGRALSMENMMKINDKLNHCEWCCRDIKGPNYKRWHGENCKYNPANIEIKRKITDKIVKCNHCNEDVLPHIYAQNHGDYCKHNPNRLEKKKRKKVIKVKDQKCIHCGDMFDKQNIKQHSNSCAMNPESEKYKKNARGKISRKNIKWYYNETTGRYKTSLNITEDDVISGGWTPSTPPINVNGGQES